MDSSPTFLSDDSDEVRDSLSEAAKKDRLCAQRTKNSVTKLSKLDLRRIFLGKKTLWKNGMRIRAARLSGDLNVTSEFLKSYTGLSLPKYKKHWRQKLFSGGGVPPRKFRTEADILKFIRGEEAGIGFVSAAKDMSGLKVITIE